MSLTLKAVYAWAAVGKPNRLQEGKVLRGLRGQYGIYTTKKAAQMDCPNYGEVRRVRITVVKDKP